MIATGPGITAQIPYIRHLLEAHQNREIRTQHYFVLAYAERMQVNQTISVISLDTDRKDHRHWVSQRMTELLKMDKKIVTGM